MINPKTALEKMFTPGNVPKLHNNALQYVDLHIIDGCNLKCARCFKFSPLCKGKRFELDPTEVCNDLYQLKELTKGVLKGISIIGGEPLYCRYLHIYMQKCRELFPNTDITIITNGILIPKMSKEFFKQLKELDIMLAISKYYEDDFYWKIQDTLHKHGCQDRYVFSCVRELGCAMFLQMELDEEGKSDPKEIWDMCSAKNGCVLLKEGKLWSCSNHCMKYLLNRYFGTKLIDYPEDGIDIYTHTYREIIRHLKKPKKGCRYCTKDIYKAMYFPEESKLSKEEWIKTKK